MQLSTMLDTFGKIVQSVKHLIPAAAPASKAEAEADPGFECLFDGLELSPKDS